MPISLYQGVNMQSIDKPILSRLAIKRAIQDIITDDLNYPLNEEQFKTGVSDEVVVWVTGMNETYDKVQNGRGISSNLIIEFNVISSINETGVHEALGKLMKISPTNERLLNTGVQIMDIFPVSSETVYEDDASEGAVIGTLALKITYLARV